MTTYVPKSTNDSVQILHRFYTGFFVKHVLPQAQIVVNTAKR